MIVKKCFIVCFLILISNKIISKTFYKESFADTSKTFFLNEKKKFSNLVAFSFDYQPRFLKNNAPFFVNTTKGWNINYIKEILKLNRNFTLGLNFNLSRRVEECEIKNLNEVIFTETKFNFKLKLLMPHIGIIILRKYKSLNLFGSVNIGYGFDDEYAYKYHYIFNNNVCDTVNFKYEQKYTFKKKFPVMFQIGFIKNFKNRFFIKYLIYNNEFSTRFIQNYYVSSCNETNSNYSNIKSNDFGFNIGFGVKF